MDRKPRFIAVDGEVQAAWTDSYPTEVLDLRSQKMAESFADHCNMWGHNGWPDLRVEKNAEIARLNAAINGLITGQANAQQRYCDDVVFWMQRAETAEAALAVAEKKLALLRDGKVRPLASNDFRRPVVYCRPLDLASGVWPTLYDTLDDALEAVMKKIND